MLKLEGFFAKFKRVLESAQDEREAVTTAILSVTGIKLPEDDITVRNGEISVSGSPMLKSKIFISKQKILAHLEQKFPKKFRDIR